MTYNEILEELRGKLTGENYSENAEILKAEGEKYARAKNDDGIRAVGTLMLEIMPEEQVEEIKRLTHIDGERLDEIYKKIVALINEKNCVDAKPIAEKLYCKITEEYKEGENSKFVSTRNPFEDALLHNLFKPEKTINRTPFDFCTFISAYAFILVETGSTLEAIPVLEKAIEFNPVDCGPKFELAEVYKLLKNKKKLIEVTKDTLKVASSPVALARCYANMGYMCADMGEYDDAVVFYTVSSMVAPHPAIPYELRSIAQKFNKPIVKPEASQIEKTFAKYELICAPDPDVIKTASQLSATYLAKGDISNALNALKILYNLTKDEEIKQLILKYDPNAQQINRDGTPINTEGGTPNITRTVNENPEA